jgi:hypothetical protein
MCRSACASSLGEPAIYPVFLVHLTGDVLGFPNASGVVLPHLRLQFNNVRRDNEFLLAQSLLQADTGGVLVS